MGKMSDVFVSVMMSHYADLETQPHQTKSLIGDIFSSPTKGKEIELNMMYTYILDGVNTLFPCT